MRGILLVTVILVSLQSMAMPRAYDRHDWKHWLDSDKNCRNTRTEVLIRDAQVVGYATTKKCKIKKGTWFDPYTLKTISSPTKVHIDHIVPLKHAHLAGAESRSAEKKAAFANDEENLIAVDGTANIQKGAKSPDEWKPHISYWCTYAQKWVAVKMKYKLRSTAKEKETLRVMLETCKFREFLTVSI